MKKIFRSIQTLFPCFHDLRFRFKFFTITFFRQPHEKDFQAFKYFHPDPDKLFIDIGANRGETISSILIYPHLKNQIIAFEPNQIVFKKLLSGFSHNKRIVLYNYGLGDENTERVLYVPYYRKWMFDGLSSFKKNEATSWLQPRLWRFNEKKQSIYEMKCKIKKLDDLELNPCFIKIDVQGFEYEAIKGGLKTISEFLPVILIENISTDIIDMLQQLNYGFYSFEKGAFHEQIGKLNTFCINKDIISSLFRITVQ